MELSSEELAALETVAEETAETVAEEVAEEVAQETAIEETETVLEDAEESEEESVWQPGEQLARVETMVANLTVLVSSFPPTMQGQLQAQQILQGSVENLILQVAAIREGLEVLELRTRKPDNLQPELQNVDVDDQREAETNLAEVQTENQRRKLRPI
jgi:hypothetical protein